MESGKSEARTERPTRFETPPRAVLVVDDDPAVGRSLRRALESAGYDVAVADDGNVAIETLMRRSFDVVLSDIRMPGMSGVELLSVVRACDMDVPVILMTGAPTVETAIEAVSLGAVQYLSKPTPMDTVLSAIDNALRSRRIARSRRDTLPPESEAREADLAELRATFQRALDGMWMAFQPIVDSAHRRVFGYEALMRTPGETLSGPNDVLLAAERLDRLPDLGARIRGLCAQAFERAPDDALLFVNLHPRDLLDKDLYEAGSPLTKIASRVVLEITERSTLEDVKDIQARMAVLRYHGYRIAIDDLGAGYAGLSSLVSLGPEIVKLDMSLVRGVHRSEIRQRVIGSLVALCGETGMRVVAEGVEIVEERDAARRLGCDLLQGHLFARPGPPFPAVGSF
ncbi:MAG TPA: EAL domain-containing protein [Polyangiaceae bacterium]|jgi:EAL domain-containing protein (putative c-di-GMP-specific phosphodiesterase class I)|nr:EAL domain-containing protein [Polyangiaceae bacterium]